MASEIGDVAVRVGADITDLKAGMSRASDSVGSFGSKSTRHLRKTAATLAKVGTAAAAAGAALTIHLVNNARQAIDAQAKMAQQLDTTSASLATLQRAGELSGVEMKTITTASRTLAVRIGEAQQGLASAKDAFDAMGLSAAKLAELPLDERISAVNNALQNNVDASQRAAYAADLFGTRAATAMKMLDDGTLATARREAELFGLALSDVDAAKVEQANDAMSTIGSAVDGLAQQFTVQLAPILKAVGEQFVKTAEEAGGMGNIVSEAFESIVGVAGFVMDAVEGVKRAFSLAADGIIIYINKILEVASAGIVKMMGLADAVPGIDMSESIASVQGFSDTAAGVVAAAQENIKATLAEPMPSEGLKKFVQEAQAAGQAAADAAVKAREAVGGEGVANMDDARTPAEKEAIEKRLEAIREANMTELELLSEKYALEVEAVRAGLAEKQIAQDEAYQLSLGAADRYAQAKLKLEQDAAKKEEGIARKKEEAKKAILSQAFGGLTALMNSESRKMFEIGKAAAISQSIVSTYTGMTKALELGWPLGPVAAGAIALNGFAQVAKIRKQSFGGGAGSATGSTTGQINAANTPVGGQAVGGGQGGGGVMYVRGLDAGQLISKEQLVTMLNDAERDGYKLRVAS